jgi:hypothetical protein
MLPPSGEKSGRDADNGKASPATPLAVDGQFWQCLEPLMPIGSSVQRETTKLTPSGANVAPFIDSLSSNVPWTGTIFSGDTRPQSLVR